MDGSITPLGEPSGEPKQGPRLLISAGRGRIGGSTSLYLAVRRARDQGRQGDPPRPSPNTFNAAFDAEKNPIPEGASLPEPPEPADFDEWLSAEMAMADLRRITNEHSSWRQ